MQRHHPAAEVGRQPEPAATHPKGHAAHHGEQQGDHDRGSQPAMQGARLHAWGANAIGADPPNVGAQSPSDIPAPGAAPLLRGRTRHGRRQPLLHPHPNLRIPHQLQHAGGGPPVELEVGGGIVKHRQLEGTLVLPVAGHPQAGHQRLQLREAAVEGVRVHGGWGGGFHSPWGWGSWDDALRLTSRD